MEDKKDLLQETVAFEEVEKVEEFGPAQDYLKGLGIGVGIVVAIVTLT